MPENFKSSDNIKLTGCVGNYLWKSDDESCTACGTNKVIKDDLSACICAKGWTGDACDTCDSDYINGCKTPCIWNNMKTKPADAAAAKAAETCECKDDWFGATCNTQCTGDKHKGTYSDGKCDCADGYWRKGDDCINTCGTNEKPNGDKTGCICDDDSWTHNNKCVKSCGTGEEKKDKSCVCKSTHEKACECKDGFSGNDCS